MCIDILEILFWIANWQMSSMFEKFIRPSICRSSARPFFSFPDDNLSKYQWIFTKIGMYIDIVEIWF